MNPSNDDAIMAEESVRPRTAGSDAIRAGHSPRAITATVPQRKLTDEEVRQLVMEITGEGEPSYGDECLAIVKEGSAIAKKENLVDYVLAGGGLGMLVGLLASFLLVFSGYPLGWITPRLSILAMATGCVNGGLAYLSSRCR